MPIMTFLDREVNVNIQPFGFCQCMDNPDRAIIAKQIMDQVEEDSHDILDSIMDFFMGSAEPETDEYADCLMEKILVPCSPDVFSFVWSDASEDLYINGEKALTTKCSCICRKCAGLVKIADDGQENAAFEQQSKTDLSNWKEGDPIPEASASNLQQLEQLGKTDTDLYNNMKEHIEKREELDMQIRCCDSDDEDTYNDLLQQKENLERAYKNAK